MILVLVVEDDPMLAEIHRKFIDNTEGFKVIGIASDGVKALEMLKENPIDLVLLDIYMPKMDGLTLVEEMRKTSIASDLILVTASKEVEQVERALKFGVFDYLVKPFEFDRLKQALFHYKSRVEMLDSSTIVEQGLIDRMLLREGKLAVMDLPKGMHMKTLERVRKAVQEHASQYVDIDAITAGMDVSKVTVRRYLDYLAKLEEVEIQMHYGTRGRPSFKYKVSKK
ncbi:MAG: response regulator [Clostridia bacterium]|nr:response regulator [Clostridia bacterium]